MLRSSLRRLALLGLTALAAGSSACLAPSNELEDQPQIGGPAGGDPRIRFQRPALDDGAWEVSEIQFVVSLAHEQDHAPEVMWFWTSETEPSFLLRGDLWSAFARENLPADLGPCSPHAGSGDECWAQNGRVASDAIHLFAVLRERDGGSVQCWRYRSADAITPSTEWQEFRFERSPREYENAPTGVEREDGVSCGD